MMQKVLTPLLLSLSLLLSSCGGGGGDSQSTVSSPSRDTQTFSLTEKEFVHDLFLTEYLWYDQVSSNIEYNNFSTPQSLINELRVDPPDLWSFTITAQEYEDYVAQETIGFGFGYTSDFTIYLVRIDAPAWGNLQRGDEILEINGEAVSNENIANASKNINEPTTFTVLRGSNTMNVLVTSEKYTFKVTLGKIIDNNGTKVGYLRYDSFTGTSVDEFEQEFTKFKKENISELVIDLRYNGGGSVDTTSALIDNISNTHAGQRQMYLDWNANYKSKNTSYYFEDAEFQDGNELNMARVVFLVTKNSASASEALISALVPYLGTDNIITIGDATHGKPVGMSGKSYGSNYYFLINFFVNNNANNSTGFEGILATCRAKDDIRHQMGDPEETMLNTALYYIEHNNCP